MTFFRLLLVALLLSFLAACAPVQHKPVLTIDSELLWQERQKLLRQLTQWEIRGRTAITQGDEAWNVGLNWRENKQVYRIKLMGPFSQGGVNLDGTPEQVVLTLSDGQMLAAATPEALLSDVFELHFPISALRDWVGGLPYEGEAYQQLILDDEGRLTHLEQQDWQIDYHRYEQYGSHSLPTKLYLSHPDIDLRLVINSWKDVQ